MKDAFNNKALKELEPFKKPWGGYIFSLHVEKDKEGDLRVHSPDLRGFHPVFRGASLAAVNMITWSVQMTLNLNFDIEKADVYYMKKTGSGHLIDGDDETVGLAPSADYEIIVVPEGTLKKKLATLPKGQIPKNTCPILRPGF